MSTLQPGVYALVGPNAAGKTHYLHSLFSRSAAFVPASADALFAGSTVGSHVRAATAATARPGLNLALDHLALDPKQKIRTLSVGQRRALSFHLALAAHTPLLLLDEPFDGLDITTRNQLRTELIDALLANPEMTVVIASHRSEDFVGLANYVIQVAEHHVSDPIALDTVRAHYPSVSGPSADIDTLAQHHTVLQRTDLGPTSRATFYAPEGITHPGAALPEDAELIDILASTSNEKELN